MRHWFINNKLLRHTRFTIGEIRAEGFKRGVEIESGTKPSDIDKYELCVSWPIKWRERNNLVIETGFFHTACHLDLCGLWKLCSLNTNAAQKIISEFKPIRRTQDVIALHPKVWPNKYTQTERKRKWDGIVLAAQIPSDRAVTHCSPSAKSDEYWQFVRNACKYYGKDLFVKIHPRCVGQSANDHASIAHSHGCGVGDVDLGVIRNCQYVITYNSTFAVDAWLLGKRVVQFAPGYFFRTGAVTFTHREIGKGPEDTREREQQLLDFLFYRYCYYEHMELPEFVDMLEAFACADDGDLFPLPEILSYGSMFHRRDAPS
jgi:hypothetical protein